MNLPLATFGPLTVYRDKIARQDGFKKETHPLSGVTVTIETGSQLEARVTVTRLAAMGIFALLKRKRTGGEQWMTIEGPDFTWVEQVDRKKVDKARGFVGKLQTAVKQSA